MNIVDTFLYFIIYIKNLDVRITNFLLEFFFIIITQPVVFFFVELFSFINISNFFIFEWVERVFAFLFFSFLNALPGSKISWDHAIVSIFAETAHQSEAHNAFINFCNKSALTSRKILDKPTNPNVLFEAF